MSDPSQKLDENTFGLVMRSLGMSEACRTLCASRNWQNSALKDSYWKVLDSEHFRGPCLKAEQVLFLLNKFPNVTDIRLKHSYVDEKVFEALTRCRKLDNLLLMSCTFSSFEEIKIHREKTILLRNSHVKTIDIRGARFGKLNVDCMSLQRLMISKGAMKSDIRLLNSPERVFCTESDIMVNIKSLTGRTIIMWVPNSNETIAGIKERYEAMEGVPADAQRYIYAGKRLEDGRSLADYNFQDGGMLHLVLRLRGGSELWTGKAVNVIQRIHDSYVQNPILSKFSSECPRTHFQTSPRAEQKLPGVYDVKPFIDSLIHRLLTDIKIFKKSRNLHCSLNSDMLLNDMKYRKFFDIIVKEQFVPIAKQLFREYENKNLKEFDCFVVFYEEGHDENFGEHKDPSDVTVNLCLSNMAEGCDVSFQRENGFMKTITPKKGRALFHKGGHSHRVEQLGNGTRCNLVTWMRFE